MSIPRTVEENEILRRVGEKLKSLRLARKITQEDLASDAGFSRSYYTEIETGKRNVSILNLYCLSQHLKISLQELLTLDEGVAETDAIERD